MGLDIHLAVENKWLHGWKFAGSIDFGRDSVLFAEMASVRGTGKYTARGLPNDIDFVTRDFLSKDGAEHTFSWLTAKEMLSIKCEDDEGENTSPLMHIVKGYCKAYGKKNVRLVFGFDS